MKFVSSKEYHNYTKEQKRKFNQNFNQMKYRDKNKEYYNNYQKIHYADNKKHRCRTMKTLYYRKAHNKEILWIKPPLNYEEYIKKLDLKVKYN